MLKKELTKINSFLFIKHKANTKSNFNAIALQCREVLKNFKVARKYEL